MRPTKGLDKIYYLFNRLYPRPEVGVHSRLTKVHFLKSGPAMAGSAGPVPPPLHSMVGYDTQISTPNMQAQLARRHIAVCASRLSETENTHAVTGSIL